MANVLGFAERIGAGFFWGKDYMARHLGLSGRNWISAFRVGD